MFTMLTIFLYDIDILISANYTPHQVQLRLKEMSIVLIIHFSGEGEYSGTKMEQFK